MQQVYVVKTRKKNLTINSLTAKSVPAGTKLVLFGRYIHNIYVGIVRYILRKTKTRRAKIYLPTQCTNQRKSYDIDEESFVKIARNSWQAEVIARSTRYQTLQTDKNLARNYSTTKLV